MFAQRVAFIYLEEGIYYLEDWIRLLEDVGSPAEEVFARECRIRDQYADRLGEFRPRERLLKTENGFAGSLVRADMRTVDSSNALRIWEFKIEASYDGLGQILTYVALEKLATSFQRDIQGVLAAFTIKREIRTAISVLHLGIELVELPHKLRLAGGVPALTNPMPVPDIPLLTDLTPAEGEPR